MKGRTPLSTLLWSFRYATRGIGCVFRSEQNFRIHLLGVVGVVVLAWWLEVPRLEWVMLLLACGLVLSAEALNTALEYLANALHPEQSPHIARVKDAAAAGVLLAALAAGAVGAIIFLPKLWAHWQTLMNP